MPFSTLSPKGETLVVLDTNVLLPPRTSDVLMDLRLTGLCRVHWTLEIEVEFKRNYKRVREKNRDKALPANAAQNRLDAYHGAIPDWEIVGQQTQLPNVPAFTDAKDRHVVAAALQLHKFANPGDVVYLVSRNLKDMDITACAVLGILVRRPGAFIDELCAANKEKLEQALLKTIRDRKKPPGTKADMISLLRGTIEAKATADAMERSWFSGVSVEAPKTPSKTKNAVATRKATKKS